VRILRTVLVAFVTLAFVLAGTEAAQAKSPFSVSITLKSASTTELGKSVSIAGTVSPNAKGKTVSIQRRYGSGSWKTVATKKLTSTSKYSASIKTTAGGPTSYRVVKATSSTRSTGYSSSKTVDVFRWRDLTTLPNLDSDSAFLGNWYMNGNNFPASISTTLLNGAPSWNIAVPKCTKIRTYVGMDDDSLAGSTGSSQLLLDFPSGPVSTVSSDDNLAPNKNPRYVQKTFETGHTKLSLGGGITTPGAGTAYLTLGSPKLYCNS
jgi:hypothetical protein